MGGAGQLQTAANDRAMQRRYDRHAAKFDRLKGAMPEAGMFDRAVEIGFDQFAEIEPGREMLAGPMDHRRFDTWRKRAKRRFQSKNCFVVQRITLGWAIEANDRDVALNGRGDDGLIRRNLCGHGDDSSRLL